MKIERRELFYIPNLLTYLRLLLMPLPIWLIVHGNDYAALALVAFGMATDIFDGILARRLNQISELGKILDPLTDKLATAALVVTLTIYRNFPVWAAVIIIGRDLIFLSGALVYIVQGRTTPVSNLFGKLTALAWGALVISYLTPVELLHQIMLYLAVAMVPISFIVYLYRTFLRPRTAPSQ